MYKEQDKDGPSKSTEPPPLAASLDSNVTNQLSALFGLSCWNHNKPLEYPYAEKTVKKIRNIRMNKRGSKPLVCTITPLLEI
jgi:hypothetical protein